MPDTNGQGQRLLQCTNTYHFVRVIQWDTKSKEGVEEQAVRLKIESRSDTDVAVIAAEDLKWVAEHWRERTMVAKFALKVFNITDHRERAQNGDIGGQPESGMIPVA